MKKVFLTLICIVIAVLFVYGYAQFTTTNYVFEDDELEIYTSNYALESMTKLIVGNKIELKEAYDFKTDVHEKTSLTTKETESILKSDMFICISEQYEPYVTTIEEEVKKGNSNTKIVKIEDYYDGGIEDEHIFLSPKQALKMNDIIYNEILDLDSYNKEYYTDNYNMIIKQLTEIDKSYEQFAEINNKTIYAEHDAYYWLREDYNLDIKGIYGKSHEGEVTAKEIENIVEDMKGQQIHTMYVENNDEIDPVIKTIQKETNTNIEVINNLEINSGLSYIDIYENNLEILERVK